MKCPAIGVRSKREYSVEFESDNDTIEITHQDSPDKVEKILATHNHLKARFKLTKD
jgi:hypothetical protein